MSQKFVLVDSTGISAVLPDGTIKSCVWVQNAPQANSNTPAELAFRAKLCQLMNDYPDRLA